MADDEKVQKRILGARILIELVCRTFPKKIIKRSYPKRFKEEARDKKQGLSRHHMVLLYFFAFGYNK